MWTQLFFIVLLQQRNQEVILKNGSFSSGFARIVYDNGRLSTKSTAMILMKKYK